MSSKGKAPDRKVSPKDYFTQTSFKDWEIPTALSLYKNYYPDIHSASLFKLICNDVQDIAASANRRGEAKKSTAKFLEDLNCIINVLGEEKRDQPNPASKTADVWNSFGKVTQNNYAQDMGNKRKDYGNEPQEITDSILYKKGKKSFSFFPANLKPSISTDKARINNEDRTALDPFFVIKISDETYANMPEEVENEYQKNMKEQAEIHCLRKLPNALAFLKAALDQNLHELPKWLWCNGFNSSYTEDEVKIIAMLRLILTDYYANCIKPSISGSTNERTPFAEHVIPIFKYFSAVTKMMAFV
ncbi:hypothetical protein EC973_005557, partial [Apophysomyces ossiformis]